MKLTTKKTIKETKTSKSDVNSVPESADNFEVLKYTYAENSSVIRNLFLKKFTLSIHKDASDDDSAVNRTLIMVNVPPYFNDNHAKFLFERRCGHIQKVFFEQKASLNVATSIYNKIRLLNEADDDEEEIKFTYKSVSDYFSSEQDEIYGYKACYIVFATKSALNKALDMTKGFEIPYLKQTEKDLENNDSKVNMDSFCTGLKKMELDYNKSIIPPKRVIKDAEAFIAKANAEAEEELARIKLMADMKPDEDGWMTVNRNLRRNRQALVSNQFRDQKIKKKYNEREEKRKMEEEKFEQSVDQSMLTTGNKKKRKKHQFSVNFFEDPVENPPKMEE